MLEDPRRTIPERSAASLRDPSRAGGWRRALVGFAGFAWITCFLNLGGFGLISMEPMVAASGRAMLESGSWAAPRLYGELHTFKPALAYWMSAAAQALFGRESELLLRLPFALSGALLGLLLLLFVGRRLGPRAGLLTGMAAVGTPLFLERVRLAEFDTPLAAGVGLAVAAAVFNLTARRASSPLWLLGYLGLAAGFLAKGTPALMVYFPGLALAALLTGSVPRLLGWRHLAGLAFGAVLIGGYLGWALLEEGASIFELPAWEAGRRGLQWTGSDLGLTLLKPGLILVALLPWSAILLWPGLARASAGAPHRELLRAGGGFFLGGLLAFVAVPTHEMRYYLPLVPSFAIVAGAAADLALSRPPSLALVRALRSLFVLTAAAIVVAAVIYESSHLAAVLLSTAVLGWAVFRRPGSGTPSLAVLLTAVSLLMAVGQAWVVAEGRARSRNLSAVADQLRPHLPATATLWVVGPADPAGKHGSLYHALPNPVRTFCGRRPPPEASFLLLVDEQRLDLSPELGLEQLAVAEQRGFQFGLARVTRRDRDPGYRLSLPAAVASPGVPEPASRSVEAPAAASRCTLSDYRRVFDRETEPRRDRTSRP